MVVGYHVCVVHAPSIGFWLHALAVDKDILIVEAIRLSEDCEIGCRKYYYYRAAARTHLLALRHMMQQMTTSTMRKKQVTDMLQKAICSGSLGSHQYSVVGG